jgi:plasmid maintenance system antidote protein VapI
MNRRQFNQREAAEFLGLNDVHFSQILNNKRQPGLANAIRIEQRTGISVESWALSQLSTTNDDAVMTGRKRRASKALGHHVSG